MEFTFLFTGMSAIVVIVLTRQILALKANTDLFTELCASHGLLQVETAERGRVETLNLAMERRVGNLHKLESFGVLEAANGREAFTQFADRRGEIAVVRLDLMIPVMDGAATLRELRRLKPELPVLFASGYSAKDVLDRLDGEKSDGFLQKPFTLQSVGAARSAAIFRAAVK